MGSFRQLSSQDVKDVLSAFSVAGYLGHEPIEAGTVNTNIRVKTTSGSLFLRVNEGKVQSDVAREVGIVAHVAALGVPTPVPLRAADGRRYAPLGQAFVSLFPWVAGGTRRRSEIGPQQAQAAGLALAHLHAAGATYADHQPSRYEPDEIARRFAVIQSHSDPSLLSAQSILGPELASLSRARAADLPLGLIHGDLFIDNVLFDEQGQLTALLDFEQASWGRLAYDVAVTTLAFGFGRDDFRTDVTRALLDAYRSVRQPSQIEREAFGAELQFAACRFAVTRITDVYLRRGQGAPGGKDFNRYLARLDRVKRLWRPTGSVLSLP